MATTTQAMFPMARFDRPAGRVSGLQPIRRAGKPAGAAGSRQARPSVTAACFRRRQRARTCVPGSAKRIGAETFFQLLAPDFHVFRAHVAMHIESHAMAYRLLLRGAPDRRHRKYEEFVMSIVATYTFALQHGGHATFYIARNGCPSGAALYFLAAHLADGDGSLADRFHRANKAAELTSADGHDDLSYRYAVDLDGHLHAFRHDGELLEWDQFFSGHYAEFINGHAPLKVLGDGVLKHVKTSGTGGSYEWVTRGQLVRRHAAAMETLSLQCERFPERADVIAGYRGDVDALALSLQRYNEGEDVE
ncbi:hypothetical protein [Burkholderia stagnalis]|uniref:hypothetical protein n=1 Tax=Burkholderia stagnalis TaxID=1503054 RepID=UPI001E45F942|nr:hypothetical protein [Burkholderia stagnalis]